MIPNWPRSISPDWNNTSKKPMLNKGIDNPAIKAVSNQKHKKIGELIIPRLGFIYPIVEGTDDEALKKGVGLYVGYGTVKPGQTGHVVLSGHRDTVFRRVGELKTGDRVYVKYQGYTFTYQIRKTWITDAEDRTVIVPHSKPVMSLTTCYPFDYVGDAPQRYIIRTELVEIRPNKNTQT